MGDGDPARPTEKGHIPGFLHSLGLLGSPGLNLVEVKQERSVRASFLAHHCRGGQQRGVSTSEEEQASRQRLPILKCFP